MAISKAVLPANRPESITDSPYEGKKKGKNIITKIPNPNPLTRWIKLATMVSKNMSKSMVISEIFEFDYKDRALLLYEQYSMYFR